MLSATFLASVLLGKGVECTVGWGSGLHHSNAHNTLILLHYACMRTHVCEHVLLNEAVNCSDYILSVTDEWMSMEHWWNDKDRAKTEVLREKNPVPGPLFQHMSHTGA